VRLKPQLRCEVDYLQVVSFGDEPISITT